MQAQGVKEWLNIGFQIIKLELVNFLPDPCEYTNTKSFPIQILPCYSLCIYRSFVLDIFLLFETDLISESEIESTIILSRKSELTHEQVADHSVPQATLLTRGMRKGTPFE